MLSFPNEEYAKAEQESALPPHSAHPPVGVATANPTVLKVAIAVHDLIFSLVPYTHHAARRARRDHRQDACCHNVVHLPCAARPQRRGTHCGIIVLNKAGLDLGINHLSAVKVIDVKEFHLHCSTLPAPDYADNPLGYKFSWSLHGGLLVLLNSASFLANSTVMYVAGADLMASAQTCAIKSSSLGPSLYIAAHEYQTSVSLHLVSSPLANHLS
ncbi:hypothetical protein B0H14DRAFT_3511067 [Mycena olivaceomarginata]|nr:hypothetical protein B0H14DRAFT_3511067 [Mycena olivaceomarginata]